MPDGAISEELGVLDMLPCLANSRVVEALSGSTTKQYLEECPLQTILYIQLTMFNMCMCFMDTMVCTKTQPFWPKLVAQLF